MHFDVSHYMYGIDESRICIILIS
uniref:Uncharacterized protein n=1 Tax=Rhizophora mucronata TaxID=61149 RepID=A0A2P2NZF2_RHIMU